MVLAKILMINVVYQMDVIYKLHI